ncbi:hypothetical protein, partial [Bacillus alkalicola]
MRKRRLKAFIIKLLVIMLVLPPGLFNFSATASADEVGQSYQTVYETDFSSNDHNVRTDAGGTGDVEEVTIDGQTY